MRAQPNLVLILADDMGWGDLGCYGGRGIPTPAMDQLAKEGVRCTDCHSTAAICSPSRYSVLTGRYAWRGPLKRGVLFGHAPAIIESSRPTLASVLGREGYATAMIGKWHLGLNWCYRDGRVVDGLLAGAELTDPKPLWPDVDRGSNIDYARPFTGGPVALGFERFFGMAGSLDMAPFCFLDQDRTVGIPDREKDVYYPLQRRGLQTPDWQDEMVDVRFSEEATAWIRAQAGKGRRFFLELATSAPHRPCLPPEFAVRRSRAGRRGDLVWLVDWVVRCVLDALDECGIAEETFVVVTSDNGGELRGGERERAGHKPNGDWRGAKADIWEGGHRVPFIARWPGSIEAGGVVDQLICLSDVMATFARVAGVALPEGAGEDSIDVFDALRESGKGPLRRTLVHHSADGTFSYRRDWWKVVFGSGSGGSTGPKGEKCGPSFGEGQLYHLGEDPLERWNLWDDRADVVDALYRELKVVARGPASGLCFDVPIPSSPRSLEAVGAC